MKTIYSGIKVTVFFALLSCLCFYLNGKEIETVPNKNNFSNMTTIENAMDTNPLQEINKLKLIAHRGLWRKGYPQNSKEGIEAALQSGLGGFECDIRQTADRILILNHDEEIGGITIDKHTLDQIKETSKENPPLLTEILELKSKNENPMMYAEIKSGDVDDILNSFNEYGIKKNVIFKSFDKEICKELIEKTEIPVYLLSVENNLDYDELKNEGFSGVSLMFKDGETTKELIDKIHSLGLFCAFWTVNDLKIVIKLNEWNADHIVSDLNFLYRE